MVLCCSVLGTSCNWLPYNSDFCWYAVAPCGKAGCSISRFSGAAFVTGGPRLVRANRYISAPTAARSGIPSPRPSPSPRGIDELLEDVPEGVAELAADVAKALLDFLVVDDVDRVDAEVVCIGFAVAAARSGTGVKNVPMLVIENVVPKPL